MGCSQKMEVILVPRPIFHGYGSLMCSCGVLADSFETLFMIQLPITGIMFWGSKILAVCMTTGLESALL